jgi:hypothetical protein
MLHFLGSKYPEVHPDQIAEQQLEFSHVRRENVNMKKDAKAKCSSQSMPTLQLQGYILTKMGTVYKVHVYPTQQLSLVEYWTASDDLRKSDGKWTYSERRDRRQNSTQRFSALFPDAVYRKFKTEIEMASNELFRRTEVVGWPFWGVNNDSVFEVCTTYYRFEVEP